MWQTSQKVISTQEYSGILRNTSTQTPLILLKSPPQKNLRKLFGFVLFSIAVKYLKLCCGDQISVIISSII